jgi:hypothetical protein
MIADYDKVRLLIPFSGAEGVGGPYPDLSPDNLSVVGGASTTAAQSKFYGSSVSFNGTSSNATLLNSAFTFGFLKLTSSVHTVDVWVRPQETVHDKAIFDCGTGNNLNGCGLFLTPAGALRYIVRDSTSVKFDQTSEAAVVPLDAWSHIRVSTDNFNVAVAVDGQSVLDGVVSFPVTNASNSNSLCIGYASPAFNVFSNYYKGWMNDLVIHKDAALPASGFTPPPAAAGTISGTVRDDTGTGVARTILLIPRTSTRRTFNTTSASDGTYSRLVPATDFTRIVFSADSGPLQNDLIDRVVPV